MLKRTEPNMHEEMLKRQKILLEASKNKDLQSDIVELCKRDILFWFRNFVYTDKNTRYFTNEDPSILPFIPYPFQEELILEVWESIIDWTKPIKERKWLTSVFIEKSRQMWVSWVLMYIFVYGFLFHNHKYHVISQKEELVDKLWDMKSLFWKARFCINHLPKRMLPTGFDTKSVKYMTISRPDGTGAITGESANPNAGRWGTYNAIFLDEFAFMSNAQAINTACISATPCRIYNSTPNGEWNEFYRMRKLTIPSKDPYGVVTPPQIKWLRYHRSEHPKKDQDRYNEEVKGMSREKIAQELEINYNIAIVGRVYTDFPSEPDITMGYDPELPLYVSIDNSHWWTDPHAVILAQRYRNEIRIIDSVEVNCSVTDMAEFMTCQPKSTIKLTDLQLLFLARYRGYNRQKATFISDPHDTHSTLNQSTIYEEYKKVWIYLNTPRERNLEERILKVKPQVYRTLYNNNCMDFASAMMNARYPEKPETSNSTTKNYKPIHDRTSHYRTSYEYLINFLLENPTAEKKHNGLSDTPLHNKHLYSYRR